MACHMTSAKPSSEKDIEYCELDPCGQIPLKFNKNNIFTQKWDLNGVYKIARVGFHGFFICWLEPKYIYIGLARENSG